MRTITVASRFVVSLLCILAISSAATAVTPAPTRAFMCTPGELIFSDDFDPATVSDRWIFKAEFALRDGALLRTNVDPTETKRVFLKDPTFHNTIIQFDSHLRDNEFVLGKHPIIDRTRQYFAFQFDLPGASIDRHPTRDVLSRVPSETNGSFSGSHQARQHVESTSCIH